MARITCRHGAPHQHEKVEHVKYCQTLEASMAWEIRQGYRDSINEQTGQTYHWIADDSNLPTYLKEQDAEAKPLEWGPRAPKPKPDPDPPHYTLRPQALWSDIRDEVESYNPRTGVLKPTPEGEEWLAAQKLADSRDRREQSMDRHPSNGNGKLDDVDTDPGVYWKDGRYYKVQRNRAGTHLYAKMAVRDHETNKWGWEYAKGAVQLLRRGNRLSPEQASEFGKLNSCCINCFAELTREESMDRGYGPQCAKNYGWPYDHNRKG
jgi:hypothetical protein